jgi:hypothetical protein
MALDSKDIPVTREDVQGWLEEYAGSTQQVSVRDFIDGKIQALNLESTDVHTAGRNLSDTTPLVDLIMADIGSYDVPDA